MNNKLFILAATIFAVQSSFACPRCRIDRKILNAAKEKIFEQLESGERIQMVDLQNGYRLQFTLQDKDVMKNANIEITYTNKIVKDGEDVGTVWAIQCGSDDNFGHIEKGRVKGSICNRRHPGQDFDNQFIIDAT